MRKSFGSICSLLILWLPARGKAGHDDEILLGNDAAMVAGAVVATVNDGGALWYNPAGLALASKSSVDVSANAFALRHYAIPRFVAFEGEEPGDARFTEIVTIPSALTYLRRFSPSTVGSVGLFVSHYNDVTLRASARSGQILEGDISFLTSMELVRYHLIAGIGTKLTEKLSFGFSLSGDYQSEVDVSQATFIGGESARRVDYAGVVSAFSETSTLGFHVRAGLIWQALSWLRLGLSVESPGFYFYRSTRTTAVQSQALNEGRLEAESSDETLTKLTLRPYAPVRARLGAALTLPSATLSAEVDVQSPIKDDTVDVHRKASWNVRAGARIRLSERYRFGAGLFTDRDPDRVYNGTGAIHFYGGTAGVQYENVRWLATENQAGEARSGLTFSTTVAVRYAYGSGKFGGLYYGEPDWTQTIRPTNVSIHELTLHIGSGLYF